MPRRRPAAQSAYQTRAAGSRHRLPRRINLGSVLICFGALVVALVCLSAIYIGSNPNSERPIGRKVKSLVLLVGSVNPKLDFCVVDSGISRRCVKDTGNQPKTGIRFNLFDAKGGWVSDPISGLFREYENPALFQFHFTLPPIGRRTAIGKRLFGLGNNMGEEHYVIGYGMADVFQFIIENRVSRRQIVVVDQLSGFQLCNRYPGSFRKLKFLLSKVSGLLGRYGSLMGIDEETSGETSVYDGSPESGPLKSELFLFSGIFIFVVGTLLSYYVWMKVNKNLSPNPNSTN